MDVSLYQLTLSAEPKTQPLSVSPATLQSTVGAFIDVLIGQQLSATLWVKLPPGEVWLADIERYHQQVGVSHTIYLCTGGTDEPIEETSGPSLQLSAENGDDSQIIPIQLIPTNQLKREYFLVVSSAQFCGLVLAHRSQNTQGRKTSSSTKHSEFRTSAISNSTVQSLEDSRPQTSQKKKTSLSMLFSFEKQTVEQVLAGLQPLLVNSPHSVVHDQELTTDSQAPTTAANASLLTQLIVKQVQRQEEIWCRADLDRSAAVLAVSLQQQNEVLLNDLNSKNELLNNALLELRTPLTNMKTALTLLESSHLKPAQRQRYMHLIHTECDRQGSVIRGLLELLQLDCDPQSTTAQPIQLADLVPGVVSTYQPLANEKGVQLGYTVPTGLPTVACMEAWLRQIVINLLHNSIKFTLSGGNVIVQAKQQGEYVQLEFRDTGIGIAPSEIPKIFDRFYRGRPVPGEDSMGAGLGLTMVQQLLLRCGGSISVTSKLGQGSTFKVLLPVN